MIISLPETRTREAHSASERVCSLEFESGARLAGNASLSYLCRHFRCLIVTLVPIGRTQNSHTRTHAHTHKSHTESSSGAALVAQ